MTSLEQYHINKDSQLDIDFKASEPSSDQERANKLLEDLNLKYPNAKLIVSYKGNNEYSISGKIFNKRELEKEFKSVDRINTEDDDKKNEGLDWYRNH